MMEKFFNTLKKKVEDETAAFVILGAMIITFAIVICVNEYVSKNKVSEVNADIKMGDTQNLEQQETKNPEDFETLDEITSKEDLKKLQEKEEESKDDKNNSSKKSTPKYYIKVNYGAQVVNIYTKDENGEYTVPVKAMVCSTGTHTPTSGVYTIGYRWTWLRMIGDVYGHYVTQITGDILFHSVPYLEKGNHSSLEWWAYDMLGTKASLGCVRLTTIDAKWIFDNIGSGTKVEFYSSSNPGPLGKPTARKISNAPSNVKGWDPTDPDKNNPWPKYLKELENQKDNEKEDEEENKNEIKNETNNNTVDKNEIVNDITNDIINDVVNDVDNDANSNNTTNSITNDTEQDNNAIEDTNNRINDVVNESLPEQNLEVNVYVSEVV